MITAAPDFTRTKGENAEQGILASRTPTDWQFAGGEVLTIRRRVHNARDDENPTSSEHRSPVGGGTRS